MEVSKIWNPLKRVKFSRFFRPSTNCTQAFWTSQGYEHSKVLGCRAKQPQDKERADTTQTGNWPEKKKNSLKMTCNLFYVIEVSKYSRDVRRQEIWKLIWNEHVHKREETKTQMRHLSSWMSAEYSLQPEIKYSLISCQDKWQKYAAKSKRTGEWLMVQRERTECIYCIWRHSHFINHAIAVKQTFIGHLLRARDYTPGI